MGAGGRAFKSPRPDQWFQWLEPFFLAAAYSGVVDIVAVVYLTIQQGPEECPGQRVILRRDSSGRITRITDTLGHQYNYGYDGSGNLASVTFPGIATPAQYGYSTDHLLTSETDSRGSSGSSLYYPDGKIKSVTDAAGQTTSFAYNIATSTTTVTNPDGGTITTVDDVYGMPLSVTDPLGRTATRTYDTRHNGLTETNPLTQTTTYAYDANGFRTSLKDPLNNIWSAAYNAAGGPTSVTNPLNQAQNITYDTNFSLSTIADSLGQVAAFTYNGQGLPLTLKDARQNTSSYVYDTYGNRTSYTDPLNRSTTTVYDVMGRMTSQTDPRGNSTLFGYDALGRKTSMTDAYGKTTTFGYDVNGNRTSETDALNRTTTYTYDSVNRLTQITYPDNTTKSYTYDFRGGKLTETDQLGRVTKRVYDLGGQLSSMTAAFGTADSATSSYTYDLAGRKVAETDPRGNTITYGYDAAGRMTSVKDAAGNVTQYGYDAKGQRTSMTDTKNRVATYTYDSRGRQLTTTTPDSKTTTKTYDGLGLMLSVADEESRTTQYIYDAVSQLKTVIDSLNQQTQYAYDLSGNKISQTDANNHTTTYAYDKLNRRTQRTLPMGQSENLTYDVLGNNLTRTDFNGKTTSYGYDALNRLLTKTPDTSFGAGASTFTYTLTGQRATMGDPSGTTTYAYDNRDRVITKATPQGTLMYTYDGTGNVTSVLSSNANGTSVLYGWDTTNRLSSVTDNRTTGVTTYTYDATNQLSTILYPNSVQHAYSYDVRDRLMSLAVTGPSGQIATYTQGFSPSGRKASVGESSGRTVNYAYDAIYRLLNENISGNTVSSQNGTLGYALDPVGNRQSLTSTLVALSSQSFTYDANDRITSDTFDANGNTTTSGGVTYTYDFEDRLLTTSSGIQIVYDGDGNRVLETAAGVTTRYLVDDLNPTGYAQVAEEVVNGTVTAQYTLGVARISQRRSAVSYFAYDGFGTVRQLLDTAGGTTDSYLYDGFGNVTWQSGTTPNQYLYRAEAYDPAVAMYYLRARWYRQEVDRFLTADSFYGMPNRPASLNRYAYSEADPVDLVDPTGYNAGDMVLRGWRIKIDIIALARQAVIAYGVTCVLVHVWNQLDHANMASGGLPTLPTNLLPQCQDRPACAKYFPNYVKCSDIARDGYTCGSLGDALSQMAAHWGRPVVVKNPAPLERGPCSIGSGKNPGQHYSTQFADGGATKPYPGSVGCCECCTDLSQGAFLENRCKVLNVDHQPYLPPIIP